MTDRRRGDADGCTDHEGRSNGLEIGYRGLKLNARGMGVYLALAVLGLILSILFSGYLTKEAVLAGNKEHVTLRTSQDRTACIVAMTPEERTEFRKQFHPGAFTKACPWMVE
jgi:hypothetical protein